MPFGREVGLGPSDSVLHGDPDPLPKNGAHVPIFGPCLLWPSGWMDGDATWYGSRPRPRPHCATWGPSSPDPQKGHILQFSAHIYCGQTAGWIKMPLGTEVGLGPGHIVLNRDPATPPPKRGTGPQFSAHVCCGQTAGWINWCHLV